MDADIRSICELTLTSDRRQSKVKDRLLISAVSHNSQCGYIIGTLKNKFRLKMKDG
jgi:hypothetical protein